MRYYFALLVPSLYVKVVDMVGYNIPEHSRMPFLEAKLTEENNPLFFVWVNGRHVLYRITIEEPFLFPSYLPLIYLLSLFL